MTRNTDHIVCDGDLATWLCKACGERYYMNSPCPLIVFIAAQKAFLKAHRSCRERKEKSHAMQTGQTDLLAADESR